MNVNDILRARDARRSRQSRPFLTFLSALTPCVGACEDVLAKKVPDAYATLLARSSVITAVTAVEVYFRDMLDAIFKICDPSYIETRIKHIHPEKYNISDLIDVYKSRIHPLELVVRSQSFQNVESVERVFSKFIDRGFWSAVLELQVRLPEKPEDIATWSHDQVEALRRTFELRHELVHDPRGDFQITTEAISDLQETIFLIFGADVVISAAMQRNRDPALTREQEEAALREAATGTKH